tara:strand:+ start:140 stop:331 length:192 start_codon:yes stop_codon:yes gene_type:complete
MRIYDSSVKNDVMKYWDTSTFIFFLNWLHDEKNYTGRDIINVVESPYKYNKEFNQFYEEEYNG